MRGGSLWVGLSPWPACACPACAVLVLPLALSGQNTDTREARCLRPLVRAAPSHPVPLEEALAKRSIASVADFCGEKVVERHMSRLGREPLYECITAASKTRDSKAMELVLMEYGEH